MTSSSRRPGGSPRRFFIALACVALCWQGGAPAASGAASHVHPVDAAHSWMRVHVGKTGLFSFAGDEHQVNVPIASGSYDDESHAVEITIDAARMEIQDAQNRRGKVQANMLGPQVLDVAKYPTISFRSTSFKFAPEHPLGDAPRRLTIDGDLTLHGRTRPVSVFAQGLGPLRFTGSASLKQSDFGITPIKVAGGAVRVKDQVDIVFDIKLK